MSRRGFTLVEVLVALAIFALVATGGVSLLRFTVDSQEVAKTRLDKLARFERMRAALVQDLSQTADRPAVQENGVAAPAWQARALPGDGLVFAFVRRGWENPEGELRPSLQYVEYDLAGGVLRRRTRRFVDGAPLGSPRRLIEGVRGYRMSVSDGRAWRQVGPPEGGAPPRAVMLELDTADYGVVRQLFLLPG